MSWIQICSSQLPRCSNTISMSHEQKVIATSDKIEDRVQLRMRDVDLIMSERTACFVSECLGARAVMQIRCWNFGGESVPRVWYSSTIGALWLLRFEVVLCRGCKYCYSEKFVYILWRTQSTLWHSMMHSMMACGWILACQQRLAMERIVYNTLSATYIEYDVSLEANKFTGTTPGISRCRTLNIVAFIIAKLPI